MPTPRRPPQPTQPPQPLSAQHKLNLLLAEAEKHAKAYIVTKPTTPTPTADAYILRERLRCMSLAHNDLLTLRHKLENVINAVPTGETRNLLTEINLLLEPAIEALRTDIRAANEALNPLAA